MMMEVLHIIAPALILALLIGLAIMIVGVMRP